MTHCMEKGCENKSDLHFTRCKKCLENGAPKISLRDLAMLEVFSHGNDCLMKTSDCNYCHCLISMECQIKGCFNKRISGEIYCPDHAHMVSKKKSCEAEFKHSQFKGMFKRQRKK